MKLIYNRIKKRVARSFRCLPFNSLFYMDALEKGLSAETVFRNGHRYAVIRRGWFKSSEGVEAAFRWLIKIGVLRREVDGQGLTSRVRLTPLARQILEKNPQLPIQKAGLFQRFNNCVHRYFPFR